MKKKAETNIENNDEYRCEHCSRSFVRPNTLLKHVCEQKRRWTDRNKPANRIAFLAWQKFYRQLQPSRAVREYTDFAKSAYYGGFVRYGNYCVDVNVINPEAYVDHLLRENTPLDSWNSDRVYTKYLIHYLRSEDGMDAIHRTVENMIRLSEAENIQLTDVFRYVNSNKICQYIASGRISPWLLYLSKSGLEFLSTLNQDQQNLIYEYIDPERWNIKFKRDDKEMKAVNNLIEEIGL